MHCDRFLGETLVRV